MDLIYQGWSIKRTKFVFKTCLGFNNFRQIQWESIKLFGIVQSVRWF